MIVQTSIYGGIVWLIRRFTTVQSSTYFVCFGSCPWAMWRCWFKLQVLSNGLSAPRWQPGTGQGKGPTLLGFFAQNLQWSLRLLALVKPDFPHPEQLDCDFLSTLCVSMCWAKASLVAKVDLQPFLGKNTFLGTWHVVRCLSKDLLELSFLPHPWLGQILCWVPRWVFRCLL